MEPLSGQMEESTSVNGAKENSMELDFILFQKRADQSKSKKDHGLTERGKNGLKTSLKRRLLNKGIDMKKL